MSTRPDYPQGLGAFEIVVRESLAHISIFNVSEVQQLCEGRKGPSPAHDYRMDYMRECTLASVPPANLERLEHRPAHSPSLSWPGPWSHEKKRPCVARESTRAAPPTRSTTLMSSRRKLVCRARCMFHLVSCKTYRRYIRCAFQRRNVVKCDLEVGAIAHRGHQVNCVGMHIVSCLLPLGTQTAPARHVLRVETLLRVHGS